MKTKAILLLLSVSLLLACSGKKAQQENEVNDVAIEKEDNIPENYVQLNYLLLNAYEDAEDWDNAQEICNKLIDYAINTAGKESLDYAIALFNQKILYEEKGDKEKASLTWKEIEKIIEKLNMTTNDFVDKYLEYSTQNLE